ncbi:MAG: hypothetical protein FJ098_02115, partial [Deltaproteobacteria bacterium]|nr:hypothetical protein [Deltaproteobacteria bacterium]
SLISTVSAFLDNVVTGNHASKDGGGVHVCVDCDPHAVPFLLDNTITGNETDNEDPTEGAAGVGAAFLRVFQSNNVHGNTRDGEPSDFGWFHAAETVGGEWPDWVRDVAVAGNWWGTVDPEEIEATIFDGADAAGYGRARWEPALEGPLDGPLPRLTLATEELSYPDPDDPMPVHLTLYNPGPLRELEVLILLEYTEGMRVPYQGGIGLPAERTAGGAYLVTLPEGAVHFATLVAPARPVETGTDHGEWHASLFDAATGERIGPVISSRWDFPEGSEP